MSTIILSIMMWMTEWTSWKQINVRPYSQHMEWGHVRWSTLGKFTLCVHGLHLDKVSILCHLVQHGVWPIFSNFLAIFGPNLLNDNICPNSIWLHLINVHGFMMLFHRTILPMIICIKFFYDLWTQMFNPGMGKPIGKIVSQVNTNQNIEKGNNVQYQLVCLITDTQPNYYKSYCKVAL